MAQTIHFDKDSIGLETVNGVERFHCICEVRDGAAVVARRLIQGCVDFDDLKTKAADAFADVAADAPELPAEQSDEEKIAAIKADIPDAPIAKKAKALEIV